MYDTENVTYKLQLKVKKKILLTNCVSFKKQINRYRYMYIMMLLVQLIKSIDPLQWNIEMLLFQLLTTFHCVKQIQTVFHIYTCIINKLHLLHKQMIVITNIPHLWFSWTQVELCLNIEHHHMLYVCCVYKASS